MNKSDINISLLMFDPFSDSTISKLEEYDELKGSFGTEVDKQSVCAYIILLYDLNTQLRKEIPHFNRRKIVAAELAGFKKDKDGKFIPVYEDIIIGRNIKANEAISKYIRLFANSKYITLVYYWSILAAEYQNVVNPKSESSDYKSTIANIEKLEKNIDENSAYLFGGNEVRDIRKELYEAVEKKKLALRPEDIANAENVDDIIGDGPYGKDYKPDKLKYKSHK